MPIGPGSRLETYEIVTALASGGMGDVWLARDLKLDRRIALKVLPPDLTQDSARVARFRLEARAASALNHPNVCTIHAVGETSDGLQFIAMEYVEGETLRQRLARPLAPREAIDLAVQIGSALTAAHAGGISHRDLKPENVMLRPDGLIKVLDFGLAKLAPLGPDGSGASMTQTAVHTETGVVVGTVPYMSPEQARGQDVDHRTDIWSLGVMLYEMLSGRTPFAGGSSSDVLAAILDREPPPLARFDPDTPSELQRIVGKALRKDREQRYQVMKDLLLDLEALREDGAPASVGEAPGGQPGGRSVAGRVVRHKDHVGRAVILAALLAMAVGGAWWALGSRQIGSPSVGNTVPVQRTLKRLTFGSGLQTDVTWSPDGRFIAYASNQAGNFDIWVQPVGGGDPVQVTRSPEHDTHPDWSPDGSDRLVFRSEREGGGLFIVPALGGTERQLTSFGFYPSWSRNGSEILFVDTVLLGVGASVARVYSVEPDGNVREIGADFFRDGSWDWIGWHPDGRISATGLHNSLGRGFYTIARNGSRPIKSEQSPENPIRNDDEEYFVRRRFQWHPSGTALYVQTESQGVYNLWKMRVDLNTLGWASAERLTTGAGPDVSAAISRDGTRLAFTTEHGSTRLWTFPFDPIARRLGPGTPVTEDDAMAMNSALSPNGRLVAYNLKRRGVDRPELWITNLVDGTSERLPTNGVCGCAWAPDGRALAYFHSRDDGREFAVAIRQLKGAERFVIPWGAVIFDPSDWSAKLGLLGTFSGESSLALWPLSNPDADKSVRVLVSQAGKGFWQGRFSPNGRWVTFVVSRSDPGPLEIGVTPADGAPRSDWTRIAADHPFADKPRWAPDGRTLYFLSRDPTSSLNLWGVRFDADKGLPVGRPFAITQFDSPDLFISPDVTRSEMDVSSRLAVLTMKTVSGSIWMLDSVDR